MKKIRLNGTTSDRGRVEVYNERHGWGTVCDDHWGIDDGNVVCRQLGFTMVTAVYGSAHYGKGIGPTLLDDLKCSGFEKHLWDCDHGGWANHDCTHYEDASVDCE